MSRRILVCGGRDFEDRAFLFHVLSAAHALEPFSVLIHGDARGADRMAGRWAKLNNIRVLEFPAQWVKHGKAAGPIRNSEMLALSQPELVIAFPGGDGTADMIKKAQRAGVPVLRIQHKGPSDAQQ